MDVKDASKIAKNCILDLFEKGQVEDLLLEEAEFHESTNNWHVIVSFTQPHGASGASAAGLPDSVSRRVCKSIGIDDATGRVTEVRRCRADE